MKALIEQNERLRQSINSSISLFEELADIIKPETLTFSKKKSSNITPFWILYVNVFDNFYYSKTGEKYSYLGKDFAALKKIYTFLKKRAEGKNYVWTEQIMQEGFNAYLEKAYNKNEWLRNNFTTSNLLSQFNQIANDKGSSENKNNRNIDVRRAFDKIDGVHQ